MDDQQLESVNGKGAEVTSDMKIPGKASILSVSPQNGCSFLPVSAGLRPAIEILLSISSKRSCRSWAVRSSRGTRRGGEQGTKAVVKRVGFCSSGLSNHRIIIES